MIQKVYHGNVEYLGVGTIPTPDIANSIVAIPKDKGLYVSTFDVGAILDPGYAYIANVTKKIDLLFYNRTNTLGKVLSTIVYAGEIRDASDTSDIPYFPELMHRTSSVEQGWDLSCVDDYTYVNWERWPPEPESYYVKQNEEPLPVNGVPSNIVNRDTPVLDGWYTLVSAGVYVEPEYTGDPAKWGGNHTGCFALQGAWEGPKFSLVQEPTEDEEDWHLYSMWDTSINQLGHFVGPAYSSVCGLEPAFIRQDFFIMSNYDREYSRYLPGYSENLVMLNDPFPSLRSKQRVIDRAATENNFKEAQLYLQSTDYLRIKENII